MAPGKNLQVNRKAILIGLGRIGWSLETDPLRYHPCTHAGCIASLKRRFSLVAVCDSNAEQMQSFSAWWRGKKPAQYSDFRNLQADLQSGNLEADFAVVATPQDVHTLQGCSLLGIPRIRDVLIEKPPGETQSDIQKIKKAWSKSTSNLWINFERRFHPGYARVRHLIQDGKLGEVRAVRGRVYSGASPINDHSGPLLHDGIHWIDLMLWFFGSPKQIAGIIERDRKKRERGTHLLFRYSDFVVALETGARSRYFEFEMEIDFSRGRIHCGNQGFKVWKSAASRRYSGFEELQSAAFSFPASNPWKRLYQEIADSHASDVQTRRTSQGLEALAWVHRAYNSL